MKFLLDVCVSSRSLTAFLVAQEHDVVSALAIDPSASDEHLLALALQEDRVLLTEDKDFGEIVFVHGLTSAASFPAQAVGGAVRLRGPESAASPPVGWGYRGWRG